MSPDPDPFNRANVHTKETARRRGKHLGLIVIRSLVLQYRKAAHQQFPGSSHRRYLLTPHLSNPIICFRNCSIILVNMSLRRLNHNPKQPTAILLSDIAMPNGFSRSPSLSSEQRLCFRKIFATLAYADIDCCIKSL